MEEKAIIIIPYFKEKSQRQLQEISGLALSAGANVLTHIYVKIVQVTPATYISSGKVSEIAELIEINDCNLVIFDGALSPTQTLNLSHALNDVKVIDRTTLILDIFALGAKSTEGKIQVETAQLKYMYPRLKGKGSALSKLGGGIGTRGPGETQLETDRRHIRRRILFLEKKLQELESRRNIQFLNRKKSNALQVSLVGYTNTGKSTLLNTLTGSNVIAEDKLFATLDPTARKLNLDDFTVIISDTVGIIDNIPTYLIEAFKSTLNTAVESDLNVIVCDVTDDWKSQLESTQKTLDDLHCTGKRLIVLNKCENLCKNDYEMFPKNCIFISARTGFGLDALKQAIANNLKDEYEKLTLNVTYAQLTNLRKLFNYVQSYSIEYNNTGAKVQITVSIKQSARFKEFL